MYNQAQGNNILSDGATGLDNSAFYVPNQGAGGQPTMQGTGNFDSTMGFEANDDRDDNEFSQNFGTVKSLGLSNAGSQHPYHQKNAITVDFNPNKFSNHEQIQSEQ